MNRSNRSPRPAELPNRPSKCMVALAATATLGVVLAMVRARPAQAAASAATNTKCPVMTDEPIDPNISVTYKGKKVYFCCPMCRKQFLDEPTKYLANLPQFAQAEAHGEHGSVAAEEETRERADAQGQGEHDRTAGRGPKGSIVTFLGKFHPVVIHFPIALILVAGLAELLLMVTGRTTFSDMARFLLPLGALSAIVAMLLGLAAESGATIPKDLAGYLEWHEILGITTTVLAVAAAVLGEMQRRVGAPWALWAYRGVLAAAMLVVGITGHLGATLVYGADHFSV